MNYAIIDATLASEISNRQKEGSNDKISIFVVVNGKHYTGTFSLQAIEELSEQSWITRLAGSRKLATKRI